MVQIPRILSAGRPLEKSSPFAIESDRWFYQLACDHYAEQFVDKSGWHALLYLDEPIQVIGIHPPFSCLVAGAVVYKSARDGVVGVWMCRTKENADFCWKCFTTPEPEDDGE